MPLVEDVLTQLLSKTAYSSRHEIYFDNFSTSYNLLKIVAVSKFRTTGTVQSNRIRQCPLLDLPMRPEEQWITVVMELYLFAA
ncbi:hypothetical protein NPIL_238491 [Nephila pilipes]|uniref:PiggyBac transposable element-derived protein domain-containing protein n=1 Tax=Nephila pilipes TaxID=299642 RepID=A0A8X6NYR7_NEPPI|nr:hypothetical protein NPIL_238491 [Nephila pilipes]